MRATTREDCRTRYKHRATQTLTLLRPSHSRYYCFLRRHNKRTHARTERRPAPNNGVRRFCSVCFDEINGRQDRYVCMYVFTPCFEYHSAAWTGGKAGRPLPYQKHSHEQEKKKKSRTGGFKKGYGPVGPAQWAPPMGILLIRPTTRDSAPGNSSLRDRMRACSCGRTHRCRRCRPLCRIWCRRRCSDLLD